MPPPSKTSAQPSALSVFSMFPIALLQWMKNAFVIDPSSKVEWFRARTLGTARIGVLVPTLIWANHLASLYLSSFVFKSGGGAGWWIMLFPFGSREEEIRDREGFETAWRMVTMPSCFPLPVAANHNNQNMGYFRPIYHCLNPQSGSEQSPAHHEDPVHADCPWSEQITFWQRKKKNKNYHLDNSFPFRRIHFLPL